MSIEQSDLVLYASAGRPDDDSDASGGAIDPDVRLSMTPLVANDTLVAYSNSVYDASQTLTVKGKDATGADVTCTVDLNGTDVLPLSPSTTFYLVESAMLDADCVGSVTLERATGGDDVGVIPPGERGFVRLFQKAASESGQVVRYEKGFYKNCHGSLTATTAKIKLSADPSSTLEIGMAATKNDSASVANRKTAPGGISFVDDGVDINLPGNTLEAGSAIGIWVKQTLGAAAAPSKSYGSLDFACESI